MKEKVKVIVKIHPERLKWPPEDYIGNYNKFKIKCKIVDEELKMFVNLYKLKLKGDKEKIEDYLSYLQRKGFKITRKTRKKYTL